MNKKIVILSIFFFVALFLLGIETLLKTENVIADIATIHFNIGNATPDISSLSLNGGRSIVLTEGTTTEIIVSGAVSDNNSCQDLVSVKIAMYKQGVSCVSTEDAENSDVCYFYEDVNPANDSSCRSSSDLSYTLDHNFQVYYYADNGQWVTTVTARDSSESSSMTSSAVSLNELLSIDVSSSLSFGTLFSGATSSGENIITIMNTGNVKNDVGLLGGDLTCDSGIVPVGKQEYNLSNFNYGNGVDLTTRSVNLNLDLSVPSHLNIPVTKPIYWQVEIPVDVEGNCNGGTTFLSI